MPPRYAYWTIIAGGLPTAFRMAEREEILPTYKRILEKHPDAELKYFARGRLWESQEEAKRAAEERREGRSDQPRRGPTWRPGGTHSDPRQPFKDAKKARNVRWRKEKFERRQEGQGPDDRRPREDRRPPGEDNRPPPPRYDSRPPRQDSRPPRQDARPLREDSRPPRYDSRPPRQGNRPPWRDSHPPREQERFERDRRPQRENQRFGKDERPPRENQRFDRDSRPPVKDQRFARDQRPPGKNPRFARDERPPRKD